jgi:hypothetical protein
MTRFRKKGETSLDTPKAPDKLIIGYQYPIVHIPTRAGDFFGGAGSGDGRLPGAGVRAEGGQRLAFAFPSGGLMKLSSPSPRVALLVVAGLVTGGAVFLYQLRAETPAPAAVDAAALERARATVRMLDDLHKGYVVTITATYVRAQDQMPAATVAKKVFKHMEGKGWASGRLIDATGKPFNEANLARTPFEKEAVGQLRKGKSYYEEVGTKDHKPVLRAATVVPAVMKQCTACHSGTKEGDLLGALVYEVPIR